MSNKPKLLKRKKQKFTEVKTPCQINIGAHIADLAGCGHVRVIFPAMLFNDLQHPEYKVEYFYTNRYSPYPQSHKHNNIVIMQRSATQQQLELIRHFKGINRNMGKILVYEIDDNLMDIPKWNFAHKFYADNRVHTESILREVPAMTVSTEPLKKRLSRYCKNIRVIPNHLPKFLWGDAVDNTIEDIDKPRILYAGSFNHFSQNDNKGDFDQELIDFVTKTLDMYQWVFVGGCPHSLKDNPKIEYHKWKPILQLPAFLRSLNCDMSLGPLEDNRFNECKSNIKALESIAIGIPFISSCVGPYIGLPETCGTTEYMIDRIQMLAKSPDMRRDTWYNQHEILKDQLFWEDNDNLLKYLDTHMRFGGQKL